jgi:hypothetical protein
VEPLARNVSAARYARDGGGYRARWRVVLVVLLVTLAAHRAARAQPTGFTYQGELNAGGALASGSFDLRFGLFSSSSGATQIGSQQTLAAVAVDQGVFTVQLDFGVDAFPGAARFLEIGVRPAGGGNFTTLAPRHRINSTPYAIRTLIATNAEQLGGLPASRYVQANAQGAVTIGTAPAANGKLTVDGGASSAVYGESTTGRGIWGKSVSSRGVYGESTSFQGVFGISGTQAGVAGESGSFHGVFGSAHAQRSAGVYGSNDAGGFGVTGVSTNGANGTGVYGESATGSGVQGRSVTGAALRGSSDSGNGVFGESASAHAVLGQAHSTNRAGVAAANDADGGLGVQAITTGMGAVGVYAESASGRAIWGKSVSSRGVYGESASFQGVFGISTGSTGVHGESTGSNGFGVYAKNLNGFAVGAEGNVTQNRDKGGWVKAIAHVGADGATVRCFNSFLPGAAASAAPCGFTITRETLVSGYPVYELDFNFEVADRFLLVTPVRSVDGETISAIVTFLRDRDTVWVHLFTPAAEPLEYTAGAFMIAVL